MTCPGLGNGLEFCRPRAGCCSPCCPHMQWGDLQPSTEALITTHPFSPAAPDPLFTQLPAAASQSTSEVCNLPSLAPTPEPLSSLTPSALSGLFSAQLLSLRV